MTISELLVLAERGVAVAQFRLGMVYLYGGDVEKDATMGETWLRKAAEQGHADAQYRLGCWYQEDAVFPENDISLNPHDIVENFDRNIDYDYVPQYEEAAWWYLQAARLGHQDARYSIGWMYWHGYGVEQNLPRAAAWYRLAATGGHAQSQAALAQMYAEGDGVTQNDVQAYKWLTLAMLHASTGLEPSFSKERNAIGKRLRPDQVAEALERVREWESSFERRRARQR